MAHKKGTGSTRNGRDSNAKRLGVKAYGGETVTAGSILILMKALSNQAKIWSSLPPRKKIPKNRS